MRCFFIGPQCIIVQPKILMLKYVKYSTFSRKVYLFGEIYLQNIRLEMQIMFFIHISYENYMFPFIDIILFLPMQ